MGSARRKGGMAREGDLAELSGREGDLLPERRTTIVKIGLANLASNMRRFVWLQTRNASAKEK